MIFNKLINIFFIFLYTFDCYLSYFNLNSNPLRSCHANGLPNYCIPPLTNMAQNMKPDIHSSCKLNQYCKVGMLNYQLLTDFHLSSNATCWNSGIIESNYINITFSFKKRFEIYYISLVPCVSDIPDAVAFYKSNDFGLTWSSWQYFANDCQKAFGMPEVSREESSNDFNEPKCFSLKLVKFAQESVIAFNPPWRRKHSQFTDETLIDRMTASDIRMSLYKFTNQLKNSSRTTNSFIISDISVGGRCKCNGHANGCVRDAAGGLKCLCQHNTEGQDCEKCKSNYLDLPWSRATANNPTVCKKCNCNLHSYKCHFSNDLYRLRNGQSGGVCDACKHHTTGTNCQDCAEGYYRDWTKPLDHRYVCKKCACHPIGSLYSNKCDKHTSQCFCKDGVAGETCNRCKSGYSQTISSVKPCIKNIQMESPPRTCPSCITRRSRIRFKKFCRKDAVFLATLQSQEIIDDKIRYDLRIEDEWHHQISMETQFPDTFPLRQHHNSLNSIKYNITTLYSIPLWLKLKDVECSCEPLVLGETYLFIIKTLNYIHQNRAEILIKANRSVILKWRSTWKRRLDKFGRRKKLGQCSKYKRRNRIRKKAN